MAREERRLARVAKEEAEHGVMLEADADAANLHKIVKRLIETPPAPKGDRGKRVITKSRGKRKSR